MLHRLRVSHHAQSPQQQHRTQANPHPHPANKADLKAAAKYSSGPRRLAALPIRTPQPYEWPFPQDLVSSAAKTSNETAIFTHEWHESLPGGKMRK
jgi:hypothetical protein